MYPQTLTRAVPSYCRCSATENEKEKGGYDDETNMKNEVAIDPLKTILSQEENVEEEEKNSRLEVESRSISFSFEESRVEFGGKE